MSAQDFTHASQLVYEQDRDRYLASLFAPADKRDGLMALYAFNLELARIRELVSEPMPGEVRLQWWRDFLEGTEHGAASANPVAAALAQTIERYHLPHAALVAMTEARCFDLYNDPMPTLNDLEGYCGETASALIQLACLVLGEGQGGNNSAELAGHAGVAYALCGLMRALPWHASRGQMYLPADLLARHGVDSQSVFRGETTVPLRMALAEMCGHARHHLGRVREGLALLDSCLAPAFLPLALVEPFLKKMEAPGHDPLHDTVNISQLRRQWILWRAVRKTGLVLA